MVASAGRRTWDSAAEGAESLGISAPPLHDRRRVRRCVAALDGLFTKWAFYCCDRSQQGFAKDSTARTVRKGFTCERGGTLADAYPCVLCRTATSAGGDGRRSTMCIRFRPNRFGRSFGRKLGVLYDDYVNNRFVSGCAINKKGEEVMLHTQEVTGSSPVAPTISFQELRV